MATRPVNDDCKNTSEGVHEACPAALSYIDIVSLDLTCSSEGGVDVAVGLNGDIPDMPTERMEINIDCNDSAGFFAAGLNILVEDATGLPSVNGSFFSPTSLDVWTRGDQEFVQHISQETIDAAGVELAECFAGTYDYNDGAPFWDETLLAIWPTCP
jgi:hypothetical protein